MRLLNTGTLQLEDARNFIAKYAILSHTWGDDELLFDDIQNPVRTHQIQQRNSTGYCKVVQACKNAAGRGLDYIWIDTCCIDKSSSAELSEALNSMFHWYRNAAVCFVYLSDISIDMPDITAGLKQSRWFSRGWTLQELLAPDRVEFFDMNWSPLCERHSLAATISKITGIGEALLIQPASKETRNISTLLQRENVATRMGWMARRETTRTEDLAYSLMGIFGINMPILYGEGNKAFLRLQERVLMNTRDQSILAWRWPSSQKPTETWHRMHFLADNPANFNLRVYAGQENQDQFGIRLTDQGLVLRIWKCPCRLVRWNWNKTDVENVEKRWLAVLDCSLSPDTFSRPAIILRESSYSKNMFRRDPTSVIMVINHDSKKSGYLGTGGEENSIQFIEYKPGDFKIDTIILESESAEPELRLRGNFPFKVRMALKDQKLEQRAAYIGSQRYVVSGELSKKPTQNPIYGVLFFGDDKMGTELVIWWGLIEEGTTMYDVHRRHNGPRLWNNSIPVCLVQSWKNLTGLETWDGRLAESLVVDMLSDEVPVPWGGTKRPSVVEVEDGLNLQNALNEGKPMAPETVIELFTQCAQPVIECVGWGMHLKASMRKMKFLGRLCCELEIEEKNPDSRGESAL